jgi:hypothetical protein
MNLAGSGSLARPDSVGDSWLRKCLEAGSARTSRVLARENSADGTGRSRRTLSPLEHVANADAGRVRHRTDSVTERSFGGSDCQRI